MTDTNATPTPPPAKKAKKPRRWRRRFLWTATILVLLGVIIRVVLPLSLPIVLRKVAGIYGMTCSYDRLELNLVSGDAGIWGLQFKPKEGGDRILATDYCHGNVSVTDLFRGRLNVWRVEADGVDVNVDRNTDGHIPLLDRFVAASNSGAKAPVSVAPATKPANSKPGDIDLSSPLRVDALRLGHIRVHIHDRGITPEIDTELAMDLRLSDLGSPDHPAKFEMNMSVDPMLDSMQVTGEGRSGGKTLDANLHVTVRGIRLKPAAAYLAPLGIKPIGDDITLRADGKFHTTAASNNAEGFTGFIAFDNLSAIVDQKEAMALDHLRIDADTIDAKSIHLARIDFDGARATGGRAADGNIQVLGIEYDPSLVVKSTATTRSAEPASPPPPFFASLAAEPWSVGEVALRNARLEIHDQAVMPAVDLSLITDELSAKSIIHDPSNPNTAVTLSGLLHAPGMTGSIKLDGKAYPFSDAKKLSASISVTGIKPDAVKPYLDQIGIESTLKNGQFDAAIESSVVLGNTITANARVTKFDFRDDKPLLSLNSVDVSDVTLDTRTGDIGIAAVTMSGPGIQVLRDSTGQLSTLGLRTHPQSQPQAGSEVSRRTGSDARQSTVAQTPTNQPAFSLASLPHITLKKFAWTGIHVDLEDQTVAPPAKVALSDIGIEASDLTTAVTSKTPGHFKAWLTSPQVADQLTVVGTLSPSDTDLTVKADVTGLGLNATPLAPYLKSFGIEPVLKQGGIKLHAVATVTNNTAAKATLAVQNLAYTGNGGVLASIDSLSAGVSMHDGMIDVGKVEIVRPRAAARRDADGSLVAAGFRLLTRSPQDSPPSAAVAAPPPQPPTTAVASQTPAPVVIFLGDLVVADAGIDWSDLAVHPAVSTSAGTSLHLSNILIGRESASPGQLKLVAHAAGLADAINVTGQLSTGPSRQGAVLNISASGLRAGPLSAYLPPKMGCSLQNGKFSTKLEVAVSKNAAGGIGAEMIAGPLDYRDENDAEPLFHLESARVLVPRIDLPDNALAVGEISVAGLQTHAEKLKSGELACMGLLLGLPVPETEPATTKPVESKKLSSEAARPLTGDAVPATGPSVKDLLASAHRALPVVTVDKLDLNVAKMTLTDLSRPESQPLVVSDLRLRNVNKIDWLGKDYAAKPPTHLQFECRVSPLIDRVVVDATVSPFARQPNLLLDFSATGVHGKGLTDLVPELNSQVDGASMENGTIIAHLEAEAKLDRRSPLDFDVSHGFDLSFLLNKVEYRAKPDGPLLAGVEEVRADSIHIDPSESFVHFKSIEITKPAGLLTQDEKGIHALGWVYKLPTTQPTVAAAAQPAARPAVTTVASSAQTSAPPTGEVRIDKLLIDGLDFSVQDTAVNPPLMIPLNGLDVEVRNISSRAPYEDLPMRFSAIVNAGKVKLAKRGSSPVVYEDRDLFSQITANGEVSLYPKLHGWAKTSVSAFELADLQGFAKQYKEDLTAGTYDMSVDLRFDPSGAIAVNSKFTLTDLSLSEPPNGLIARALGLQMPLDTAIGAVEGEDGSIGLPLNMAMDPKHISYADLGLAVAGGVSQVIVTAIAAEPMKAVNGVGGIIGLGGEKKSQDLTTIVPFPAGSSVAGAGPSAALAPLLQKLKDDPSLTVTLKHQLGAGDVNIASTRANPTKEQCANLETQLRARKAELLSLRAQTAGKARALLVSAGSQGADATLQQLRAIDRELSATEESLDQMGELLRPGAEKQAQRRTRSAALKIAADRLEGLKLTLRAAGISADRIKSISPQFNPMTELDGGEIVISVVAKK